MLEKIVKKQKSKCNEGREDNMRHYYREGWLLKKLPTYQGNNQMSTELYNCGTYAKLYENNNSKDCMMQSITDTTLEEFLYYVDILKENGYQEEKHHSIENNYFYRLVQNDKRVCANYYENEKKALVVLDENEGTSPEQISYIYEPKHDEQSEIYMFGLKMDPNGMNIALEENTSGFVNNGECLVIKCADNSLIIVDGGAECQMKQEDQERFSKLLHKITGKSEEEVLTISAWYITHTHNDHVMGLMALLSRNPRKYNLERVICNLPNPETTNQARDLMFQYIADFLQEHFPMCQEIKVHTGDVIRIADNTMTVLYTHEDLADGDGTFPTRDYNATSTVIMVETRAGMKILVTGDITERAEESLCNHFSEATLKCDILQQPHHNFNNNATVYEYANAQVMLMLQTSGGLVKNEEMTAHSDLAKKWCSEWYCGGDETVGFTYEDDRAKLIYHTKDIY